MNEVGFSDLPLEIILKIFSSLDAHTVRCVLPRVCKLFRDVVLHPFAWQSFQVSVSIYSQSCPSWKFLPNFLKSTPVHSLQLCSQVIADQQENYYSDSEDECIPNFKSECAARRLKQVLNGQFLTFTPHLKELSIVGFRDIDLSTSTIASLRIKKLEIIGTDAPTLNKILCTFSHLIELKIDSFDGIWSESLLETLQGIRKLHLPLCNFQEAELLYLRKLKMQRFSATDSKPNLSKLLAIKDLPLYRLNLEEKFMSPVLSSSALSGFLSSNTFLHLRHLSITFCRLDDKGALLIRRNCPHLWYLEIENAPSSNESEQLTESALVNVLHLKYLRMLRMSVMKCQTNEWFYKRWRWIPHSCNERLPCPAHLYQLLEGWQEIELDVSS